jgi:HK97 family phage major capsid protein
MTDEGKNKDEVNKGIGEAVKEMRDTLDSIPNKEELAGLKGLAEKAKHLDGIDKNKIENLEKGLEKLDDINQKLLLAEESAKKEKKESDERVENVELQLSKMGTTKTAENLKDSAEYKAFNELCRVDSDDIKAETMEIYKKTMRTDVNEFGGFLVPGMISSDLLKQIEQISPVRAFARVRTTPVKTLNIPVRKTLPTALYEGEAESADDSQSTYGSETMTAHRQHTIVPVTRDQLSFTGFDMSSEIQDDAMTAFAQREGNRFILGTGVKQPQGIITRSTFTGGDIETTTVETAVTFDSVIQLLGSLKVGYDPSYFFNRQTLVDLRVEKDSNGNYLWRQGGETLPTEINGFRYLIMQDMPDNNVADNIPVGIGDFFRGYNILDALQMELVRDQFTRKSEAIVEFSWNRYNDGRVVLGEAFKLLQVVAP